MIDSPEVAYWYGYMLLANSKGDEDVTVASTEEYHLDSLIDLYPGKLLMFEVETGKHRSEAYYIYNINTPPEVEGRVPVKLKRHAVRGMMDARPVFRWDTQAIDLDLPESMSSDVLECLPYLSVEHLTNGRVRLYTQTEFDTKRALEYLYRDAPVARPSRKAVYDKLYVQ